ncbi:MAG: hypothetical protein IID55_07825 [Proteobacteria bacterium]|nr:hypothetical protein [Pseudomonadota bacterium]
MATQPKTKPVPTDREVRAAIPKMKAHNALQARQTQTSSEAPPPVDEALDTIETWAKDAADDGQEWARNSEIDANARIRESTQWQDRVREDDKRAAEEAKTREETDVNQVREDMKKALFEVIYLLHVNGPGLSDLKYTVSYVEEGDGVKRTKERTESADLFVEGAPHGVQGIAALSPVFSGEYRPYVGSVFGGDGGPSGEAGSSPIVSLHSIGSIGTVGHKSTASDLDLQVVYDIETIPRNPASLSDDQCRDLVNAEHRFWVKGIAKRRRFTPRQLADPKTSKRLNNAAHAEIAKTYPDFAARVFQPRA